MQKQKAGKRKIYVFAVGMILLFLIGKYSGWSGRLLNGDLTQALQHITVENLPAAIFIYLVVTAVGSVAFALPGISFAILAGLRRLLFDETGKKQIWILMITRLVPLFPYNLQNFAYGVTDMPLKTYAVGTFLFMLPGTAMYTFGTAGLADPSIRKACFLGAAILAVAVTTAGVLLKKKVLAEQEKTDLKNGDEM